MEHFLGSQWQTKRAECIDTGRLWKFIAAQPQKYWQSSQTAKLPCPQPIPIALGHQEFWLPPQKLDTPDQTDSYGCACPPPQPGPHRHSQCGGATSQKFIAPRPMTLCLDISCTSIPGQGTSASTFFLMALSTLAKGCSARRWGASAQGIVTTLISILSRFEAPASILYNLFQTLFV